MKFNKRVFWLLFVLLVVFAVSTVLAQTETPPVVPVEGSFPWQTTAEIGAFTLLITGFFKQQLNLQGKGILLAGFIIYALLWFLPQFLPESAPLITSIVLMIKGFLATAGTFDTIVNVGAKIATATVTGKDKLSTDGSDLIGKK